MQQLSSMFLAFMHYSFAVRNQVHYVHFIHRSNATHLATESFYTDLLEQVDKVCECSMGLGADFTIEFVPATSYNFSATVDQVVRDYANYIVSLRHDIEKLNNAEYAGILTLLDEILVNCNKTLFRLRLI